MAPMFGPLEEEEESEGGVFGEVLPRDVEGEFVVVVGREDGGDVMLADVVELNLSQSNDSQICR